MAEFMQGGERSRRDLERRAAADFVDVQAQAALLRKREQAGGENAPKNIELAAYLEDPAAMELLGDKAPEIFWSKTPLQLKNWVMTSEKYGGAETPVRAALAVAWSMLSVWESWSKNYWGFEGEVPAAREGLELVEKYLLDRGSVSQGELVEAADAIGPDPARASGWNSDRESMSGAAARYAVSAAAATASGPYTKPVAKEASQGIMTAIIAAMPDNNNFPKASHVAELSDLVTPELIEAHEKANGNVCLAFRSVIGADLLPWAIGMPGDDPVRKRVEARARKAEEAEESGQDDKVEDDKE